MKSFVLLSFFSLFCCGDDVQERSLLCKTGLGGDNVEDGGEQRTITVILYSSPQSGTRESVGTPHRTGSVETRLLVRGSGSPRTAGSNVTATR